MLNWSETMSSRAEAASRQKHQNIRTTRRLIKNGVNELEKLSEEVGVAKSTMQKYINYMGYHVHEGKVIRR